MKKNIYDVIVIGASISGLSAAYEATKNDRRVLVLDARDRLGGRIFSKKLKNGLIVELGGEWLGKTHKDILAFCRKFSIELEPHRYKHGRYFTKDGTEFLALDDLMEKFENVVRNLKPEEIPAETDWYSFLETKFSEEDLRVISRVFSSDFGTHIRYVDAREAYGEFMSGGKNDHMDFHVKGGNTKMIDTLAKAVGKRNILLSQEVESIHDDGMIVTVTASKKKFYAKKLLLTIGTQQFKEIEITPPMKERKTLARNLKYGDITKAFLSFKGNLPRKKQGFSMISETDIQFIYIATQGQSESKFVVAVYAVGSAAKAVCKMKPEMLEKKVKALLPRDTFDVDNMVLDEVVVQNWGKDKYTQGAYGIFNPGELQKVRAAFGVPHGNIYFAGGYLGNFTSYINGAFQSGRDVMKTIIKAK